MEKTLTILLATEIEAREIVEEAEKAARQTRERTAEEAQEIIETARKNEEQEAQRVLEEARRQVQLARKEILAHAEEKAQQWEKLFQENKEHTIKFILDSVLDV